MCSKKSCTISSSERRFCIVLKSTVRNKNDEQHTFFIYIFFQFSMRSHAYTFIFPDVCNCAIVHTTLFVCSLFFFINQRLLRAAFSLYIWSRAGLLLGELRPVRSSTSSSVKQRFPLLFQNKQIHPHLTPSCYF